MRNVLRASACTALAWLGGCDQPKPLGVKSNEPTAPMIESRTPPSPIKEPAKFKMKEGKSYFYVSSVSDEDRSKGIAVGSVSIFRYFGKNKNGGICKIWIDDLCSRYNTGWIIEQDLRLYAKSGLGV